MNPPAFDSERMTFLRALDDAANEGIEVTDWDARFIASAFKFQSTSPAFSEPQRLVIGRMWDTYAPRMKNPLGGLPLKSALRSASELPETVPGKCAWLLTREGETRQSCCGKPNAEGSNFCPDHKEERARVRAQMQAAKARRF